MNTLKVTKNILLRVHFVVWFSVLFSVQAVAQGDSSARQRYVLADTMVVKPVSLIRSPVNHKTRVKLVTASNIAGYGGTMAGLYSAWYSAYPQTNFHFFNDNNEWKQVDKVGHAYSAYIESYASMEMWRWAGLSRKKRIWLGGLSGITYQTVIETLDGFSEGWGWSWGDFGANVFGSGLLTAQELAWDDQRIRFKFSFHRKSYATKDLVERADDLYGKSLAERMIKDYNGQTYWLSANIKSFMPESRLPAWLNLSLGYGAEGMFGAEANYAKDDFGNIKFDRRDVDRYRQFYLAPDIDLTKIKTNSRLLKFAFGVLSAFKFPMPALEYNARRKMRFHFLYF